MPKKVAWSARYAHGTETLPSTTKAEIERVLERFGATGFFGTPADVLAYFVARARTNGKGDA